MTQDTSKVEIKDILRDMTIGTDMVRCKGGCNMIQKEKRDNNGCKQRRTEKVFKNNNFL